MKTITTKEALKDYILNAIDTEGYNTAAETNKEKLQFLFNTFKGEHNHQVTQWGFQDWIKGLPSSFNIAFANHEILELGYLFGMISANANENQEDYLLNNWFNLIGEEVYNLFNDYEINL